MLDNPNVINGLLGGLGGFIGLIVREKGCIYLPRIKDHRLYLNSLTGIILGVVAGIIGDHTAWNAMMWGVGGSTVVAGIVDAIDRRAGRIGGVLCEPEKGKSDEIDSA